MADRLSRLRLHIRRNGLPDTRIVFLPTTTENTTVMQLLEQVNELVPLESPDWGLDDYVVELPSTSDRHATYECLHYQPVARLLDKDDEVIIRPLSSEDLKKRLIGGRHQISSDGKRLIDGIPFGRPLLKRPRGRPAVAIPLRKLPRPSGNGLLEFEEAEEADDVDFGMQRIPYAPEDDADEEEDEDVDLDADELHMLREDALGLPAKVAPQGSSRGVRFSIPGEPVLQESDSSDDGDFEDGSSSNSESDSESADSDSDSDGPLEMSSKKPTDKPKNKAEETTAPPTAPPNRGKARTQKRNARRRAKKAFDLARKQQTDGQGVADNSTSTLEASGGPSTESSAEAGVTDLPSFLSRRIHLDLSSGKKLLASALGLKAANAANANDEQAEPNVVDQFLPPQDDALHWSSRIDYSASECCDDNLVLSKPGFPFVQWFSRGKGAERGNAASAKAGDKRKQESDMVADEPKPKKRAALQESSSESSSEFSLENEDDSDSSEDDSEHSEPLLAASRLVLPQTKHTPSVDSSDDSSDDSYEESDSEKDCEEGSEEDSSPEASRGNAPFDEEDSNGAGDAPADESFPELPTDITSLPELKAGKAEVGMVLTWKCWVLSEQTNWQPQVTDVTGRVLSVDDDGNKLQVVLAQRDHDLDKKPKKQYDEETGERVYGRFDGPDMEDDDTAWDADDLPDDNGRRTVLFAELIEPRVLKGV